VYPAAGSHANFFEPSLHLGSKAEQGVGCDDTRGPHVQVDPRVFAIPSDISTARARFPWIAFRRPLGRAPGRVLQRADRAEPQGAVDEADRLVGRRRAWGQTLAAAARMYREQRRVFLGIGLLFIPVGIAIGLLEALVLGGFGLAGVDTTGESAGAVVLLLVAVGLLLTLLGLGLVQAATARALLELEAGRPVDPILAYRITFGRIRPLLGGLALAVAVWLLLGLRAVLLPVAIWLAVRWGLFAQVVEIEGRPAVASLRRSSELVRRRWLRVASLVGVGAVLAVVAGPLLGALLIFVTDLPLPLLNVFASVVYTLALPFVALTTSYVYFDARARHELETTTEPSRLPAEIEV
jgi:hypothetical protein